MIRNVKQTSLCSIISLHLLLKLSHYFYTPNHLKVVLVTVVTLSFKSGKMAQIFWKPMSTSQVVERIQSHVSSFYPPIASIKSKQVSAKHETMVDCKFEMRSNPLDKDSQKMKMSVIIFVDVDETPKCGTNDPHHNSMNSKGLSL